MTAVRITSDVGAATGITRALVERLSNLAPAWNVAAQDMLLFVEERFQTSTAPDGAPWAALAPETIRRRLPGKILIQSAALKNATWARGEPDGLAFGNASAYAGPKQFGSADGSEPARPFLPVLPNGEAYLDEGTPAGQLWDDIAETLRAYLAGETG